eukprot:1361796-Amorphochlora_amoeboformis.AAC.1
MTGRSTVPGDRIEAGETELPYQPLMPRIGFMEMTQKSLMEVKKRTEQLKSSGAKIWVGEDCVMHLQSVYEL